jgi:hypothetical protein
MPDYRPSIGELMLSRIGKDDDAEDNIAVLPILIRQFVTR